MQAKSIDASRRIFAALAMATSLGCGGAAIEYADVSGKVTLNKMPLAGAIVRFYPIRSEKKQLPVSSGITDAAGKYSLTHDGDKPGAVVGESKVVIAWPSRDIRAAMGAPAPKLTIPLRYTVVTDSPISVVVKSGTKDGESRTIDLPLNE